MPGFFRYTDYHLSEKRANARQKTGPGAGFAGGRFFLS